MCLLFLFCKYKPSHYPLFNLSYNMKHKSFIILTCFSCCFIHLLPQQQPIRFYWIFELFKFWVICWSVWFNPNLSCIHSVFICFASKITTFVSAIYFILLLSNHIKPTRIDRDRRTSIFHHLCCHSPNIFPIPYRKLAICYRPWKGTKQDL